MKRRVGEWLLMAARRRWLAAPVRWGWSHMNFLLPAEHLMETDTLLVFHHPNPAYEVHLLIVPKQAYASLSDLPAGDTRFLSDLTTCVQALVRQFQLEDKGYRLIANGGAFQEFPVLHFHLVSGQVRGGA